MKETHFVDDISPYRLETVVLRKRGESRSTSLQRVTNESETKIPVREILQAASLSLPLSYFMANESSSLQVVALRTSRHKFT